MAKEKLISYVKKYKYVALVVLAGVVHMLRHGETVFLDDYTVERLSRELGSPVQIVDDDGGALLDAMLEATIG